MKIAHILTHNQQHPSFQSETSTSKTTNKPMDTQKTSTLYPSRLQVQRPDHHTHTTIPSPPSQPSRITRSTGEQP